MSRAPGGSIAPDRTGDAVSVTDIAGLLVGISAAASCILTFLSRHDIKYIRVQTNSKMDAALAEIRALHNRLGDEPEAVDGAGGH